MRFLPRILLFLFLAVLLPLPAGADLGVHAIPSAVDGKALEGACAVCHNVAATAATRGWGRTITDCTTGWFTQGITVLCWTCHSSSQGDGAHDVTATAMSVLNHSYVVANAPPSPAQPKTHDISSVPGSALPYAVGAGLQCTSCHNVHNGQYRPFLMKANVRTLCNACHPGRDYKTIRLNNTAGTTNVSVHPVDIPMDNSVGGAASIKSVAGMDNALKTPIDNSWKLGGKLSGGGAGNVSCETCHAVHGPSGGGVGVNDLLAVDNYPSDAAVQGNPLCEGCHFGGLAGGSSGLPGTVDHPVDNNGGKAFYPAGVAVPPEWTGRLDRGASVFNNNGRPRCSSCHDAHGGVSGTSMLRSPAAAVSGGVWCYSCHTGSQVTPAAHHSVKGVDNVPAFTSAVTCDMCHYQGNGGHNGFFSSFIVPGAGFTTARGTTVSVDDVRTNKDSSLCLYCHRDDDPLNWRGVYGNSDNAAISPIPRVHGTRRGSGSHYLGPDSGLFTGVVLKTDSWASDNALAVSRYGTGLSVICESCHSILYNDGAIHPSSYSAVDRSFRGWWTNLLLKPYEDDTQGIGQAGALVDSSLCTGCHVMAGNHHVMTGEILTTLLPPSRPLTLITGAGSFADQKNAPIGGGAAPGTLSYPAVNGMDCDSCHRPHSASTNSNLSTGARLGNGTVTNRPAYLLLEVDNPSNDWSSTLCLECHSK